ncbi:MAG TPA: hypothetical protein VHT30_06840 [Acidimicrobiales bacterium]|nr:hypothetical protein [Acidimicrobiales bacterium]
MTDAPPENTERPGRSGWIDGVALVSRLPLVPFGCAGAYLLLVALRFHRILNDVHLNPDASWAPVLARDLGTGRHGGHILVGTAAHFTTIWFLVLTRWVPFRTAVWDATPFVLFLASLALVAWACGRVAGAYAGLLTFALGASANGAVLLTVMSEGLRGDTYIADAVLATFLVFWATRAPPRILTPAVVVAAVLVTFLAGTTAASDPLFLACGLGPFVGAPIGLWVVGRGPRRAHMAAVAAAMGAGAGIVAVVTDWLMSSLGYRKTYETGGYALVGARQAFGNLEKFVRQLRSLGNGAPVTAGFGWRNALHAAMGLLLIGAVVLAMALLVQAGRTLWVRCETAAGAGAGAGAGAAAAGARIPATDGRAGTAAAGAAAADARFLYLAYWVLSGLGAVAAFSLTSFADGPSDPSRYVAPAVFALAATCPVWAARHGWRRVTVAAAASLFCLLSIMNIAPSLSLTELAFQQTARQGPSVVGFLEQQGVTIGYTGYFDSHPLTLASGMRVHFYPVVACRQPVSDRLCPFYVNARTVWYVARPGIRTFVLFDARTPPQVAAATTPDLGTPTATRQFGPLTVYIYDYDVASRLAPPCSSGVLTCPPSPVSHGPT